MRSKIGITKSNDKHADILKFLNKHFELNDAVIFNDVGEILARKSSLDSRLPQSILLFLKIVEKSQIRKKIGEFYAVNFYSSKQKIIYLYLLKYQLYFALSGDQNLNLGMLQLYLPEIAQLIEKSSDND
mgnify:CR=1 FL=1